MQNILNAKEALIKNKVFVQKFFMGIESANRINLIDVDDFGKCVAEISLDAQYRFSTLELCGPENLSASDMIKAMEKILCQGGDLKYITDDELWKSMLGRNAPEYSIETLLKMFQHYNVGDFCGSSFVTASILKSSPTTLIEFLKRELK